MLRRFWWLVCVVALVPGAAFAGSIPFSGSGSSGTLQTGQPFAYDFDNAVFEPDFGVPGRWRRHRDLERTNRHQL